MNPFAYSTVQAMSDLSLPMRHGAALTSRWLDAWPFFAESPHGRSLRATCDVLSLSGLTHTRPSFEIDAVEMDGKRVRVVERVAARTPFGSLLHFKKEGAPAQPK